MELSLSEARARLPELLDRVADGEVVHITRHGRAAATLVDHDRWMKTRTHDVLIQARQLRRDLEAARREPLLPVPLDVGWDVEAHIAEIRAGRDKDPWEGVLSDD